MLLTLLLSGGTALGYGVSDFIGGNASRAERPVRVAAFSHVAGLVAMLVIALVWPAPGVSAGELAWGAAAGVTGGLGIVALYAALAAGRMGVVAPITASLSAAISRSRTARSRVRSSRRSSSPASASCSRRSCS